MFEDAVSSNFMFVRGVLWSRSDVRALGQTEKYSLCLPITRRDDCIIRVNPSVRGCAGEVVVREMTSCSTSSEKPVLLNIRAPQIVGSAEPLKAWLFPSRVTVYMPSKAKRR